MNTYTWYAPNTNTTSADTIHQTLAYGSLMDIVHLRDTLGEEYMRTQFLTHPKKVYTRSSFNLVARFLLHITTPIDETKYLKSTPRNIR